MTSKWLNNRKRRPTHPGEILREDVLPGARLTQDKLARILGVSRRTISEILHERPAGYHWHGPSTRTRLRHVAGNVAWSPTGCRSLGHAKNTIGSNGSRPR